MARRDWQVAVVFAGVLFVGFIISGLLLSDSSVWELVILGLVLGVVETVVFRLIRISQPRGGHRDTAP